MNGACPPSGGVQPAVCVRALGCRVNRVELDDIAAALEGGGAALVCEDEADVVVLNTCAVTGEAEAKCRHAIRHALALPRRPWVVATGCAATLFGPELAALGERVVVEPDRAQVAARALALLGVAPGKEAGAGRPVPRGGSDGCRLVTPTGRTRPGIKVQDGCDLRCSYCIVWKARGRSRSLPVGEVLAAVRRACTRGAREVVLTGINLGRYRSEQDGRTVALPGLLAAVLAETTVGRVRLSSIEPQDVDAPLAEVMAASEGRVAPFLHMCLQSGSDGVLARMGRVYDTDSYARHAALVRGAVPGIALATDVIVGFPGETEDEHAESLAFCREMGFSKLHVFRYSRRPGTPADAMGGQVDPRVAARRSAEMRALSDELRSALAASLVGTTQRVAVEREGRGVSGGLLTVALPACVPAGELLDVRVTAARPDGSLVGVPA